MDVTDFDGTRVLERLAEVGKLDDFAEAIDADDVAAAARLLREAGVDASTIDIVLQKMTDADPP